MKPFKSIYLVCLIALLSSCATKGEKYQSLVNDYDDFQSADSFFTQPYIDVDEWRDEPVRHRYLHGGFKSNGTRFSFYLPAKKDFEGRFFQYITPFPDSETTTQGVQGEYNSIGFSVSHGAYFIETNGGGKTDFTKLDKRPDPTIGAFRANAASAEFSRYIVMKLYDCPRPYGYCSGGSGGAYRTLGCIENTTTWDGAVPYVLGSTVSIPNGFSVRMHAMRILNEKFPQIVDAMDAGGSGDPYSGLNREEAEALREVTQMGFPLTSWYEYQSMGIHGFLVLYQGVVSADRNYFEKDFWNKPGYLGYNAPESLRKARLQFNTSIKSGIGQDRAEKLGLVETMSVEDRGSADNAWKSMGGSGEGMPVAFELNDVIPDVNFLGGDLVMLSGEAKGAVLQITRTVDNKVALGPNAAELLIKIKPDDKVRVDNSNFLAAQTYHRHQVPDIKEFPCYKQFCKADGTPKYPQRPMLLGPMFTRSAAGCLPNGKIKGKIILCCSLMDREAYPWQGDWYRRKVQGMLGDKTDDNFRLWYTDHALHGDYGDQLGDPTRAVSYNGVLHQALLDLSAWVEKGIEPAPSTNYTVDNGTVKVPATADDRRGIQPVVVATVNDAKRANVKAGEEVTFNVVVEIPKGKGKLVEAKWDFDGTKTYATSVDLSTAKVSADGCRVEFTSTYTFSKPGIYFPTIRVASERNGNMDDIYTRIPNLDRMRIIVE